MSAFIAGLGLTFSLILAIGAQNAFVLKQGIKQQFVLPIILVCAISDFILIAAGVAGFDRLLASIPWIAPLALYGGALFLFVYGLMSFRSALRSADALSAAKESTQTLTQALLACLAFTWLNPHVYLDTVILIGSISTQYEGQKIPFTLGAASASAIFFSSLGYGARYLAPFFSKPSSWRWLDAGVGLLMWIIAASLLINR